MSDIIAFDTRDRNWTTPGWKIDLPSPLAYCSACKWHNYIYLIGRITRGNLLNGTVWQLNIEDGTWEQKAEMNAPRKDCRTILIDNEIYAIGGNDHDNRLILKAEKYDISQNIWQ